MIFLVDLSTSSQLLLIKLQINKPDRFVWTVLLDKERKNQSDPFVSPPEVSKGFIIENPHGDIQELHLFY